MIAHCLLLLANHDRAIELNQGAVVREMSGIQALKASSSSCSRLKYSL